MKNTTVSTDWWSHLNAFLVFRYLMYGQKRFRLGHGCHLQLQLPERGALLAVGDDGHEDAVTVQGLSSGGPQRLVVKNRVGGAESSDDKF